MLDVTYREKEYRTGRANLGEHLELASATRNHLVQATSHLRKPSRKLQIPGRDPDILAQVLILKQV